MIRASDNSLYTGITTDIDRRFQQHCSGKGAKYLKTRKALAVVFEHRVENRSQAQKLEHWIKQQSKTVKEQIITQDIAIPDCS